MKLMPVLCPVLIFLSFACSDAEPAVNARKEADDPEGLEISYWAEVSEGINSGFGNTNTRYSRSKPPAGGTSHELSLAGWKGEKVHSQLLFWSTSDQGEIKVVCDNKGPGTVVPDSNILIRTVKYVLSDEFSNGCGHRDKDTVDAFLMPDLLDDTNTFYLGAMQTRPVWISIILPSGIEAGVHNLIFKGISGSDTVDHKIRLEVQDRTLPPPSEWSFHLDLWQNPYAVARYHDVELWSQEHMDLLRPLITMLAEAGQKCITTTINNRPWGGQTYDPFGTMVTWIRNTDGLWDYDYSAFDQYVKLAMDCGINKQINCFSMVPWGNEYTWFDQDSGRYVTGSAIPGSEEYMRIWKPFLEDFRVHLMEMGWLEKTSIALDERSHDEMSKMITFLRETAPDFKIAMAGHYFEDLGGEIYDFSYNWWNISEDTRKETEERKQVSQLTTFYVACGVNRPNTFTFSPPAEAAFLSWFAAAMSFDGFLRWAYNSWPEDPAYDSRYIKWPAGDTYLVYPGARSSIRFEKLIEGIQDFEKLCILRKDLSMNPSMEAAGYETAIENFLVSFKTGSLDSIPAEDIIKQGKTLLYDISSKF